LHNHFCGNARGELIGLSLRPTRWDLALRAQKPSAVDEDALQPPVVEGALNAYRLAVGGRKALMSSRWWDINRNLQVR
jgi:hypothetical protein